MHNNPTEPTSPRSRWKWWLGGGVGLAVLATGAVLITLAVQHRHDGSSHHRGEQAGAWSDCDLYCDSAVLATVQAAAVFPDSKTFVDMPAKSSLPSVAEAFSARGANLTAWVDQQFAAPASDLTDTVPSDWQARPAQLEAVQNATLREWGVSVNAVWKQLSRQANFDSAQFAARHTLLALPKNMIVAGERFREMYYWDMLPTAAGLLRSGMLDTVQGQVSNMIAMLDSVGFVPNGARRYYSAGPCKRSQPPILSELVVLVYQELPSKNAKLQWLINTLPALQREWAWWMSTHVVTAATPAGKDPASQPLYLRFTTNATSPRPESWAEDNHTASALAGYASEQDAADAGLFAAISAAAESGWDFSSRWLRDPMDLATFHTPCVLPADLHAIAYRWALNLAWLTDQLGAVSKQPAFLLESSGQAYAAAAARIAMALRSTLWDAGTSQWRDWHLDAGTPARAKAHTCPASFNATQLPGARASQVHAASNFIPLWAGCGHPAVNATRQMYGVPCVASAGMPDARAAAAALQAGQLWLPGGVPATTLATGQQWDFPSAWAPNQWMLVGGLESVGANAAARELAERWINSNFLGWERAGVMFEKYNASRPGWHSSGGEYKPQVGFGWTNGVALDFLVRFAT